MPTRTMHGGCIFAASFQKKSEQGFAEQKHNYTAWLGDFKLFVPNEFNLLRILRRIFEICPKFRFIRLLLKFDIFLSKATCCGRTVDTQGVQFHPKNTAKLEN